MSEGAQVGAERLWHHAVAPRVRTIKLVRELKSPHGEASARRVGQEAPQALLPIKRRIGSRSPEAAVEAKHEPQIRGAREGGERFPPGEGGKQWQSAAVSRSAAINGHQWPAVLRNALSTALSTALAASHRLVVNHQMQSSSSDAIKLIRCNQARGLPPARCQAVVHGRSDL